MDRAVICAGLTVAAVIVVGAVVWRALNRMEHRLMANFDALNEQIAGLGTALDEAIARIDADFQALRDQLASDATDQAAVDAATAALSASVDRLRALDPDPTSPVPGGGDVPAEPGV